MVTFVVFLVQFILIEIFRLCLVWQKNSNSEYSENGMEKRGMETKNQCNSIELNSSFIYNKKYIFITLWSLRPLPIHISVHNQLTISTLLESLNISHYSTFYSLMLILILMSKCNPIEQYNKNIDILKLILLLLYLFDQWIVEDINVIG